MNCAVLPVDAGGAGSAHSVADRDGILSERYGAKPGTCYLFRPDQHVCGRWREFDLHRVRAAVSRASGEIAVAMHQEAA